MSPVPAPDALPGDDPLGPPAPSAAPSRQRSLRLRTGALVLLALAAVGLLAAACGGGTPAASSSGSKASSGAKTASDAGSVTTTTLAGTSPGSGSPASSSFTEYQSCLKKHGVSFSFPAGGFRPGGANRGTGGTRPSVPSGSFPPGGSRTGGFAGNPKFAAAEKACAKYRPTGGFGGGFGGRFGGGGAGNALSKDTLFTACLKDYGVTLPSGGFARPSSTTVAGAPSSTSAGSAASTTTPHRPGLSAKEQEAFSKCAKFLPAGFNRSSTTTTAP